MRTGGLFVRWHRLMRICTAIHRTMVGLTPLTETTWIIPRWGLPVP